MTTAATRAETRAHQAMYCLAALHLLLALLGLQCCPSGACQ